MTTIQAFKTSDGTVFPEDQRREAEEHETKIKMKGIIQSSVRGTSFTPGEIADIMIRDIDTVLATLMDFKKTCKRIDLTKQKAITA